MTASTAVSQSAIRRRVAGLLVAIALGVALATQARINGELAGRIGDGVAAAQLSVILVKNPSRWPSRLGGRGWPY